MTAGLRLLPETGTEQHAHAAACAAYLTQWAETLALMSRTLKDRISKTLLGRDTHKGNMMDMLRVACILWELLPPVCVQILSTTVMSIRAVCVRLSGLLLIQLDLRHAVYLHTLSSSRLEPNTNDLDDHDGCEVHCLHE